MEALHRERRDCFNPAIVWLRWRMRRDSGPNSSSHFPKIKNDVSITRPTASYPEQRELITGAQINLNRYEVFGPDAAVQSVKRGCRAEDNKTWGTDSFKIFHQKYEEHLAPKLFQQLLFINFFDLSYFMLIPPTPCDSSNRVCSPKHI